MFRMNLSHVVASAFKVAAIGSSRWLLDGPVLKGLGSGLGLELTLTLT